MMFILLLSRPPRAGLDQRSNPAGMHSAGRRFARPCGASWLRLWRAHFTPSRWIDSYVHDW